MARKVIGLWLDETSDPNNPAWIVSRDAMNENGEAETTTTVQTWPLDDHEDAHADATAFAIDLAIKDGLCLIQTDEDGQVCLYDPASEHAKLVSDLKSRDDRFHGGAIADTAEGWIEAGFDAATAAEWMDAGFWDADAAARVRDLGVTPEQARERADDLADAEPDAAEVYTDGDPIYSICNGDTSTDVLLTDK